MSFFPRLPDGVVESVWLVPVIGLAASGLAFLVGWRLFGGLRSPDGDDPALDFEFLKGVNRERRGTARRRGNTVEVVLSFGDDRPDARGWVIDRSQGGLCLLVERDVPVKTALRVRPKVGGEGTPWAEVSVRSCRAEGHQFELGCQFHQTPNYNLLLKFG